MNDDDFKSMLRGAEAGLEKPRRAAGGLARRVRQLDASRRRRTRFIVAMAPVAAFGTIIAGWLLLPQAVPVNVDQRVAGVSFDHLAIERLRAEAELHERAARSLIAQRGRDRAMENARRGVVQADPFDAIREQIDVVAYRMIQRADRLQARMMESPEAIELYRDVVRLFPKTYSAQVARRRLAALGAGPGEA